MAETAENLVGVVNCSEWFSSEQLMQDIIGHETPSEQSSQFNQCFPWTIDNKYYTTKVKFVIVNDRQCNERRSDTDATKFSAVVVIFDSTEKSFKVVNEWLSVIKSHEPSVLLLVASKSGADEEKNVQEKIDSLPRLQVLQWCIEHSFELVDLNEEVDPEDDFPDTVGIARIIQALQTTEWPHLEMKDNEKPKSSKPHANNTVTNGAAVGNGQATSDSNPFISEVNSLGDIVNGLNDSDGNEESFEEMFSQMRALKEKASNLPAPERKDYAEQVALAFWRAIGGDEDEIADLDATS